MMPGCERCWREAGRDPYLHKVEEYHRLIASRECTPEQQAGESATKCESCGRVAVHQYVGVCMACHTERKVKP